MLEWSSSTVRFSSYCNEYVEHRIDYFLFQWNEYISKVKRRSWFYTTATSTHQLAVQWVVVSVGYFLTPVVFKSKRIILILSSTADMLKESEPAVALICNKIYHSHFLSSTNTNQFGSSHFLYMDFLWCFSVTLLSL